MKWEKVQAKGDIPPGVAAHSAVVLGKNIYIFGGMTADGASNSMYRFNTGTLSLSHFFLTLYKYGILVVYKHPSMIVFIFSACRQM